MDILRQTGGRTGGGPWVLLATLILIIYSNTFSASWQLDDYPNIVHNTNLHLEHLRPEALIQTFFDARGKDPNQEGRIYRPVANLTFALNWYLGRKSVAGYHIINLLIHIFNAFLLFETVSMLLATRRQTAGNCFVALLATVLWAVNPIQTQAVTYIVQRMASLATFFYLVGLYSYVRARSTVPAPRRNLWLVLSMLGFMGALGCKENAVTLPWALILVELIFFQEQGGGVWRNKRFVRTAVIGSLAIVLMGVLLLALFKGDPLAYLQRRYAERPFTLTERILTEPRILVLYLSQLFYPAPQRLSLMHDIQVSTGLLHPWTTLPAILAIGGLIGLGLSQINKRPFVALALLFFFLNHAIESTIFPLELMFEHRNYLPSLFLFVPVAAGCQVVLARLKERRSYLYGVTAACLTILIGAVGLGTFVRNAVWRTELTLWQDVLAKAPDLARPYQKLAEYHERRGDFGRAVSLYRHALQRKDPRPTQSRLLSLNNIGHLFYRRQNYAGAIRMFEEALRLDPSYHRARYNLCLALIGSARFAAAEKQAAILVKAQPETPDVLNLMGFLLIQSGRPAEALPYFQNALRSSPDDKNSMTNLGLAYQLLGQYAEASRVLIRSVHLYPEDPTLLLRVIGNALAGSDSATANRYLTHLFQLQSADQIETLLQGMTLADRGMAIDSSALARAVALQMHAQASQIRELADAVKEHSADTGRF